MAAWGPVRRARRPMIESPDRWRGGERFTCAQHIRGRIIRPQPRASRSRDGYVHLWWEVVDHITGEVLITSDAYGYTEAIRDCSEAVFIARGSLFWSIGYEGVR